MLKTKFKASALHLLLSVVVVSLIMLNIIYFWFPLAFLELTDFKSIATLIIAVDLVLGPVLTFVAFNPNKKSLKLDLSIIAVIQISALTYGLNALYQVHPLYITFAQNGFTLIRAQDAQPQNAVHAEYKISTFSSAKLAYAKIPVDGKKRTELLFGVLAGEPDIEQRIEFYEPYANHINDIVAKSLDPDDIFSDKKIKKETSSFLKKHGDKLNDFAYFPLDGSSKDAIIVIDKKTAKLVTNLQVNPWKYVKK